MRTGGVCLYLYSFYDYSCSSSSSPGFNTTGGALLILKAANLAGATGLAVTIGGRLCSLWLLDATGSPTRNVTGSSIDIPNQTPTQDAQGVNVWAFGVTVPAGQGSAQGVIVTTFVGSAQTSSDAGFQIDYAPPRISSVVVVDPVDGGGGGGSESTYPVSLAGGTVYVPTAAGAVLRIYGSNLGDAPTLTAAASVGIPLVPCAGVSGSDQSCYTGAAPAGEGDGLQVGELSSSHPTALV